MLYCCTSSLPLIVQGTDVWKASLIGIAMRVAHCTAEQAACLLRHMQSTCERVDAAVALTSMLLDPHNLGPLLTSDTAAIDTLQSQAKRRATAAAALAARSTVPSATTYAPASKDSVNSSSRNNSSTPHKQLQQHTPLLPLPLPNALRAYFSEEDFAALYSALGLAPLLPSAPVVVSAEWVRTAGGHYKLDLSKQAQRLLAIQIIHLAAVHGYSQPPGPVDGEGNPSSSRQARATAAAAVATTLGRDESMHHADSAVNVQKQDACMADGTAVGFEVQNGCMLSVRDALHVHRRMEAVPHDLHAHADIIQEIARMEWMLQHEFTSVLHLDETPIVPRMDWSGELAVVGDAGACMRNVVYDSMQLAADDAVVRLPMCTCCTNL